MKKLPLIILTGLILLAGCAPYGYSDDMPAKYFFVAGNSSHSVSGFCDSYSIKDGVITISGYYLGGVYMPVEVVSSTFTVMRDLP